MTRNACLELPAGHGGHGLDVGTLQKFLIDFTVFQWKCPLQNENDLALSTCSKMKFQAFNVALDCRKVRCVQ